MSTGSLEWFDFIARALVWGAGVVLLLSLVGAALILGSDSALPFSEDVQREGRGIAAVASLGAGITAAGILSGLGAILRMLLAGGIEVSRTPTPSSDRSPSP